jgi:hypothetical protein
MAFISVYLYSSIPLLMFTQFELLLLGLLSDRDSASHDQQSLEIQNLMTVSVLDDQLGCAPVIFTISQVDRPISPPRVAMLHLAVTHASVAGMYTSGYSLSC